MRVHHLGWALARDKTERKDEQFVEVGAFWLAHFVQKVRRIPSFPLI